jgi:hypothetical protein
MPAAAHASTLALTTQDVPGYKGSGVLRARAVARTR